MEYTVTLGEIIIGSLIFMVIFPLFIAVISLLWYVCVSIFFTIII